MNWGFTFRYIKNLLAELNLFETIETRSNSDHLRNAIIATRLYIIFITVTVFILVSFTTLGQQTQIVTIRNPSQDDFQELYSKHSPTLHCPCSQAEIPYEMFSNISYRFHPVCSSVFVSNSWINLLFRPDIGYFFPFDFRSSASGQFQLLASLCSFANKTVQDAIDDFLSNTLLSPETLPLASIESQNEAKSQFLRTSTIYTFRRLLNLVRGTTQMNSLQTAMQTSKMHTIHIHLDYSIDVYPLETIWFNAEQEECFCGVTSNCYAASGFFDMYANDTGRTLVPIVDPMATVTGFFVGCYALDALLHSSLECFFDSFCFTTVLSFFPTSNITNLDILYINQTGYIPSTSIEILVNNLFIEQWSLKTSYSAYYSNCAPILCTYKFTEHKSILKVLTISLGVYGGLTVILRFVVPLLVRLWRNRKTLIRTEPNTHITLLQHLRNAQRWMKVRMIQLNLFDTHIARTDPYVLRMGIISTRVYLIFMLLGLTIITAYTLSSRGVYTATIQKPSRAIFENLYNKYADTLECPCSRIVNSYESFTSLSPTFHPVCSSLFISDAWIVSISSLNDWSAVYYSLDLRVVGPAFFNTLVTLCSLSKTTINDTWYIFGQTPLITDLTLIESEFQVRTTMAIEQFRKNTLNEFQRILSLVELHTKTMYATGYENDLLYTDELANSTTPIDFGWVPTDTDTCSCSLTGKCSDVLSFYTYTGETMYSPYYLNFTVPDILIGCYVVSSVLQSSLGCFFNQTCLDLVQNEIKSKRSINVSILDANSTRFSPHSLIGTILDDLMIETWNETINYDEYYKQCAPEQCTYIYTSPNSPLQIITTLFGLCGGLSVALKIIIPLIVRSVREWVRRRREPREPTASTDRSSILRRANHIWRQLNTKVIQLNLFNSELTWDDDQRRQREIITTRIYLLLLILTIIILVIYTFVDAQTEIVKVLNPSEKQFDYLRFHPEYSTTLDCPCQNILVPYHSFISIEPHYHQLCSSDFVAANSTWIPLLYSVQAGIEYSYDDYRLFAVPQFQSLSSLCTLANETIREAITQFSTNVITNERVQSRENIESQTDTILHQFHLSTPRTFVRNLGFIQSMAQGNSIVSVALSNWHFLFVHTAYDWASLWAEPHSYDDGNCSCGTNAMCTSQASFDGLIVPGFYVGCYPLEALLQSTLECLYNITCIDQLQSIYIDSNITFNPLDANLSSSNMTVQSLVDVLFVEQWDTNMTYEQYYTACSPLWCTYTFDRQISPIYTVTTVISLYGGLSVTLKIITPILVQIGYYIIMYRRRRLEIAVAVIN